jgi:hypothetical protein
MPPPQPSKDPEPRLALNLTVKYSKNLISLSRKCIKNGKPNCGLEGIEAPERDGEEEVL